MTSHGKKKFAKRRPKSRALSFFLALFVGLPLVALVVLGASFDPAAYRGRIAEILSAQTGRTIELSGPIVWKLSFDGGLALGASDVTIGNPPWASRKRMARVGNAEMRLSFAQAFEGKIEISSVKLEKAEVQLETGPDGKGNWVFSSSEDVGLSSTKKEPRSDKPSFFTFSVRRVEIVSGRFGLKDKDGKLTLFDVPKLVLTEEGESLRVYGRGKMGGVPLELDLAGAKLGDLTGEKWPFNMQAVFGDAKIEARGSVREQMKKIVLDEVSLAAGKTDMAGRFTIFLAGSRPFVSGQIKGANFDLDSLRYEERQAKGLLASLAVSSPPKPKKKEGRIFSGEPLDFQLMDALDVDLLVSLGSFVAGLLRLDEVETRLVLKDRNLILSPFSASLAGSKIEGAATIEAQKPDARVAVALKGDGLELGRLLRLGGMGELLSGKAGIDLDLKMRGRTPRELAAQANGKIDILMDAGAFSSGRMKAIAGGLADMVFPGASTLVSPGINCLAARYEITNGFLETKGFLLDMDTTTVAGFGGVNLPDEHVSMNFLTKPKGVGVAAILPPMKVYGNLSSPSVTLDASGTIRGVADLLSLPVADDRVPVMLHAEGRNDCAVTLDNPSLAKAAAARTEKTTPITPGSALSPENLKNMGGRLLQEFGAKLLGN